MKNKAAIRLLLSANFISGIAQGMSMISIPMYFAQQAESNWFSIVYGIITVISLFWSPYGGTLIDRYNRKKIFLILNVFNGLAIGSIALLEYQLTGYTSYFAALVFALTFWNYNLHYPCFYAFMQEISEKKHYSKIASYIEVQSQLASALAGAGAALLLNGGIHISSLQIQFTPWTLADVFLLDASTYFLAFGIIYLLQYIPLTIRKANNNSLWLQLKEGYLYLTSNPYIFLFGVATHAVFIVVLLYIFSLSPIYIQQHLKAIQPQKVFAISEIWYATGAILAGLYIQKIFQKISFIQAIIILVFVTIGEYILLINTRSILLFYSVNLLLGLSNAGIRVLRVSYIFKVIPNQVIGRTSSIFFVTNTLARVFFLTIFSLPFFHHSGHVIYSFLILTIFMFISNLILIYFYPKIILK